MSSCRVVSDHTFLIKRFLSIAFVCTTLAVSAQQGEYPLLTRTDSAEVWYDQLVSPNHAAIINGPEYQLPFKALKTHPFYQSAESDRSFVEYDNDLYQHVDLLYDSYADILVLKCTSSNGVFLVKLDYNLVQYFNLHGHHFKKYNEGVKAGLGSYFDVLFEKDQFAVLVKRRKLERIEGSTSDYTVDDVYYLLNEGKWIRITGNSSFGQPFNKSQRKELAAFMKSNHINVRKRVDEDLKKLGAFCYSLKEGEK